MWKKIKDSDYFLSFKHDNNYEICVTDYIAVWNIIYTKKAFIAQLKDSNKVLELKSDDDYILKGMYLLSNTDQLKKLSIQKEDNGKVLSISMKILHGFLFGLECKLVKSSEEVYFEKITQPLLKTISELRTSQLELRHELEKKDIEINEYKTESETQKVILRVSRITAPFNDKEYMEKFKSYEEYFGSTDIPASLLEKSCAPPQQNMLQESTTVPTKKQEPVNIKEEPSSIKTEPNTPTFEEPSPSIVAPSVNCKQEAIKREQESSQIRNNDRRKRLRKLNY